MNSLFSHFNTYIKFYCETFLWEYHSTDTHWLTFQHGEKFKGGWIQLQTAPSSSNASHSLSFLQDLKWVSHCRHCVLWHHITAAPHQRTLGVCVWTGRFRGWKAWSRALLCPLPLCASPLASAAQKHLHACAKLSHPPAHFPPSSVPWLPHPL